VITNYQSFYDQYILNEQLKYDTNDINVYWINQFVKNPPDINKKVSEFGGNRDNIQKEILNLQKYLCVDIAKENENRGKKPPVPYDQWPITFKLFIKTRIWNKVVSILYGKNYNSDPRFDRTPITFSNSNLNTTAGKVFSEIWQPIDKYCNNATEFVFNGEITDTLKDSIVFVGEMTRDYLMMEICVLLMATLVNSGIGAPAAAIPAAEAAILITKYITKLEGVYGKLQKITPAVIKTYNELNKMVNYAFLGQGIGFLLNAIMEALMGEPEIQEAFSKNSNLLKGHDNKEQFIRNVKSALESHTSFRANLVSIIGYNQLQYMPNWKTWSSSAEGNNTDPQNFGYTISWYISLYCWQFQKYAIYYDRLKKLDEKLEFIEKNKDVKFEPLKNDIDIKSMKIKTSPSDATSVSLKKDIKTK
jgi:hypothetical protein